MKNWLLVCLLSLSANSFAQLKVYLGNQTDPFQLLYQLHNNRISAVENGIFERDLYFLDGERVYTDRLRRDLRFTVKKTEVFWGESFANQRLIYRIKGNQVFLQTGSIFEKCVLTVRGNQVFQGDSSSSFDLLFTLSTAQLQPEEICLLAILLGPIQ